MIAPFDQVTLDSKPARSLTSREIAKILGGLIGSLATWCNPDDIRQAIRWWAETDAAWAGFRRGDPT